MADRLLEVRDLQTSFRLRDGVVRAVDGATFGVDRGEVLGLVGESGCGKSIIARAIVGLVPHQGQITIAGQTVGTMTAAARRRLSTYAQIVFQDPMSSLDPRMTVGDQIAEPLLIHGDHNALSRRARASELMQKVGLTPAQLDNYPHEFSGGQRQRVGIARALVTRPKLVVLDEPVSALDVSVQAQILNLLDDLREKFGFSYLFVAHDLSVVSHISARVAVMYLGKIVEIGTREEIFNNPKHPYTKALISAVPLANPKLERIRKTSRIVLTGDVPSPANPPSGCRFRTRCWKAQEACTTTEPLLVTSGDHQVACHFPEK